VANKMEFFSTDGRENSEIKNDAVQEIPAHWMAKKLVTDEKGPQNKKMSRTIEYPRMPPIMKHACGKWQVRVARSPLRYDMTRRMKTTSN